MQNGSVVSGSSTPSAVSTLRSPGWGRWTSLGAALLLASLSNLAPADSQLLRVATVERPPFSMMRGTGHIGYSIELWAEVAAKLEHAFEVVTYDRFADMLDAVRNGQADVAVANISVTAAREETLDFSHAVFDSGLQIMVSARPDNKRSIFAVVGSTGLLQVFGIAAIILFLVAHIVWLVERGKGQFSSNYFRGIWDGVWWAAVTVTSVGYGDKAPTTTTSRIVALIWMVVGLFLISLFVAATTQALVEDKVRGLIDGPDDLPRYDVATVEGSTAHEYLKRNGSDAILFDSLQTMLESIESGRADAVVFDAPVLNYYASTQSKDKVRVVGEVFQPEHFAFAFRQGSPHLERVNQAILELRDDGVVQRVYADWFDR